ncbi:MAG: hypothetical protein WC517_03620 [Patescibacteria group bacterium]
MAKKIVILLLVGLTLSGCQNIFQPLVNASEAVNQTVNAEQQKQADRTQAMIKCQELCQNTLSTDGKNFEPGPCLSNAIAPDWVCDVAHSPRQAADDDPANQCESFRAGRMNHFVEVDGNCNLIKAN